MRKDDSFPTPEDIHASDPGKQTGNHKSCLEVYPFTVTLLHSERPKLHRVLAILSAIGLNDVGFDHTNFV